MVIALCIVNIALVLVSGVTLVLHYRSGVVSVQKQREAEAERVVGIRTKDGQELRYMGDEVPTEIMRLVDQKYWIVEKR